VGGIITYIGRHFGIGEDEGIKQIEGNNRLNMDTLITISSNLVHHSITNSSLMCLSCFYFLTHLGLPPRWNLLYVDDVQVLSEQDDDEGNDANLHHDVGEGANLH